MDEQKTITLGQQRVRIAFNPSATDEVSIIKQSIADLIDSVESMKSRDPRLAAISQTALEEAAMWIVKLATA